MFALVKQLKLFTTTTCILVSYCFGQCSETISAYHVKKYLIFVIGMIFTFVDFIDV